MNLSCPPLPIDHAHEKNLFNDFHGTHLTANDTNRKTLDKLFLENQISPQFFHN